VFRVAGNETLLDLSRAAPATREALFAVKGFPRGMSDARAAEALEAIKCGDRVPDADLPRFPKSTRWDRDPDFDDRVARLKTVRDAVATALDLDPGVLCSRDRMEAVARRNPHSAAEVAEVAELRRWQVEVLAERYVEALSSGLGSTNGASAAAVQSSAAPKATKPKVGDSPYLDG
ncbi:MAG: HRDC domain-containing protein, partial [Gemmatimonadota bacterium]|nr:HRDC domain-containing protein [Gemmatimonadota bacterium]